MTVSPGAGHTPPYLAGRKEERREFLKLLNQDVILSNLILTGLRGVGKTVLLDTFKPLAVQRGWLWVGADLSESTTVDEERLATRILTDLAVATSNLVYDQREVRRPGFDGQTDLLDTTLSYTTLRTVYEQTRGLVADRLKAALAFVWLTARASPKPPRGIVFAYDEAQNMADHAGKAEYPLSVMLDVFQSIQRQGAPFLLALTGLPTLFPKLVEARTYSERMFRVLFLNRLDPPDVREAIVKPIQEDGCPITGSNNPGVPIKEITAKLDSDFFAGRWSRVTDRQRDLLYVVSMLDDPESEFSVQEIVELSKQLPVKRFSSSHASQILAALIRSGIVYKNRYGKYSFAVPLLTWISQSNKVAPASGDC